MPGERRLDQAVRIMAALAFFTLLTALLFHSLLGQLSSALIGPPEDNMQDFWNSWYAAVAARPGHFFDTNLIRFPEGTPLYYHSIAYPQVFAVALLAKLFGTDHATLLLLHNLVLLASFPLAGLGAFLLVRRFTRHSAAALIGGFVFAFNPSHVAHLMHHVNVTHIECIPFFVLAYLQALERKNLFWLAAAIALYALNALFCWYYLFYLAFFMIFHAVYIRFRDRRPLAGWRLAAPLLCMAGTTLLLAPLLIPMFAQSGSSTLRPPGSDIFVADIAAFFAFPPTHLLAEWTQILYAHMKSNAWEATVYLGLANLALLTWLIWRRWGKCDDRLRYVLCAMAAFGVLAAGDTLHVFGNDLAIPLPGMVLSHLPFLANARTPSRIVVLVYLFLGVAVGYAVALTARTRPYRWTNAAIAGIAVLILIDFYPVHLATADASCPKGLDIIARDPEQGFGVLNLPHSYVGTTDAMLQQTCHGRPIATALVARIVKPSLIDRLEERDPAAQQAQLRLAHVKYIVLDKRDFLTPPIRAQQRIIFSHDGAFPWVHSRMQTKPAGFLPLGYSQTAYLRYPVIFRSADLTILRVY
jgi:hypothetical protein